MHILPHIQTSTVVIAAHFGHYLISLNWKLYDFINGVRL